jgi:hypothetical protein
MISEISDKKYFSDHIINERKMNKVLLRNVLTTPRLGYQVVED